MKRIIAAILVLLGATLVMPLSSAAQSTPKQGRLYDIGIYVTDLKRSEVFYTEVFGFKLVRRWDTMLNRIGDGPEEEVALSGMFLEDAGGSKFEFLEQGKPEKRHISQQPLNHFSVAVDDVPAALKRALSAGAKLVFPDAPILYSKIGDLSVAHTQVIGLDGERIQIVQELNP